MYTSALSSHSHSSFERRTWNSTDADGSFTFGGLKLISPGFVDVLLPGLPDGPLL